MFLCLWPSLDIQFGETGRIDRQVAAQFLLVLQWNILRDRTEFVKYEAVSTNCCERVCQDSCLDAPYYIVICGLSGCTILFPNYLMNVVRRSKARVCGRSFVGTAGSNPAGRACLSVCCECCVLSGRGLCIGLITRPEESYRVWCVWVWSWSPDNEEALAHWGAVASLEKKILRVWYMLNRVF
jgi:hypothetical protein